MNSDEIGNFVRQMLTVILGSFAGAMISTSQAAAIAAGAGALASVGWSIYSHWGMKKVPDASIVIPTSTATKALAWLALAPLALLLVNTDARAAERKPFTGNLIQDIANSAAQTKASVVGNLTTLAQQIESLLDSPDAAALATSIPGLQDTVGQACWQSFSNLSALLKAHPLPITLKVATDIEAARLTAIALNQICTNPNCGQMWTDAQNAANALAITPMSFSLPSLCSKIPAIGTANAAATVPVQPAPNALGIILAPVAAPNPN